MYMKNSNLKVKVGTVYHLSDECINLAQCYNAKTKAIGGKTYPAYCCSYDKEKSLYWMIPMSKKLGKYRCVQEKEVEKYGHCFSVVFGYYDGQEVAFHIQGMFPVVKRFILHPHTRGGKIVSVQHILANEITENFLNMKLLIKERKACTLTDIERIEQVMLCELS